MSFKFKRIFVLLTAIILCFGFSFQGFAFLGEKSEERKSEILSVSFRGDTALYPANSIKGIKSAEKKGADMVSVGVQKTADGVYVLCEDEALANFCNAPYSKVSQATYAELENYNLYDSFGVLSKYKIPTLVKAVKESEDIILILDISWEEKDGVYELIKSENALSRVFIRTKESAKKVKEWVETKNEKPTVIAVYDGNIVFNEISHFNIMTELAMPFVQYQSKNYFNVMYGEFVYKRFFGENKPKVIAPMYDTDLCGQRGDNETGWSELIEKGFSVIETNNISSLVSYIENTDNEREELLSLSLKAKEIDLSPYSQICKDNLSSALAAAEENLGKVSSLDSLQQSRSSLILAINELNIKDGEDDQKGALNITTGKVVAAITVGTVILTAEIYVHKMQKRKKK